MRLKDFLRIPPALRHRKFAYLWAGLLISWAGSQMQVWTIYWHLRLLTSQPVAVSGVGIARLIPILLFAMIGGLIADTFNRRRVLFITQSVQLVCAFVLGLTTYFGVISIWTIYIVSAFLGLTMAFDSPSRQSLISNLVPAEDLRSAFALQSVAVDAGAILGPALSGLVIATLGLQWTYWINAISFIAVLAALVLMGRVDENRSERRETAGKKKLDLSGIPQGIRFILNSPIIFSSMILDFFASFFSSANSLLPFVAQDILKVGVIGYGWLSAAQSIGSVALGIYFAQKYNVRRQGRLLILGVAIFGAATILFGASRSFLLTFIALVIMGAGDAVSTVLRSTIRQIQTPDELRGRMISINQLFFASGPRLGEVEAGLLAQAFSTPVSIISGGIGCLISVVLVALKFPQLRKYNGDDPRRMQNEAAQS